MPHSEEARLLAKLPVRPQAKPQERSVSSLQARHRVLPVSLLNPQPTRATGKVTVSSAGKQGAGRCPNQQLRLRLWLDCACLPILQHWQKCWSSQSCSRSCHFGHGLGLLILQCCSWVHTSRVRDIVRVPVFQDRRLVFESESPILSKSSLESHQQGMITQLVEHWYVNLFCSTPTDKNVRKLCTLSLGSSQTVPLWTWTSATLRSTTEKT